MQERGGWQAQTIKCKPRHKLSLCGYPPRISARVRHSGMYLAGIQGIWHLHSA
jgi:hypothetical protein